MKWYVGMVFPVYCIVHDQGANLNSQVIVALCKLLGINKTRTTAYQPRANGQVERFNRTLEAILSKVVSENQKDWDSHIPKALFAYRTAFHESSGHSPFHVNFGFNPFTKKISHHQDVLVSFCGCWQRTHNIPTDHIKWITTFNQTQWCTRLWLRRVTVLTLLAFLDPAFNICLITRPIETFLDFFGCSMYCQMT